MSSSNWRRRYARFPGIISLRGAGSAAFDGRREAAMHRCLFEERAEQLEPLSLTRPVFDLRCGITTLAEKQSRQFPATSCGVWLRAMQVGLYRAQHPEAHVNDLAWLQSADALLVNGRWLPPAASQTLPAGPCVGT